MGRFIERLVPKSQAGTSESRHVVDDHVFNFNGHQYRTDYVAGSDPDEADGSFTELVKKVHLRSGIVPAAVAARASLVSQVRFRHEPHAKSITAVSKGQSSTRPLVALNAVGRMERHHRMEQDISYAGNAFVARGRNGELFRLLPSHCSYVLGSDMMPEWKEDVAVSVPPDITVLAIIYDPNGPDTPKDMRQERIVFLKGEFAHWKPEPHPLFSWTGLSWVASLTAEVALESQIVDHQQKFFERGTVPSLVFLSEGLDDEELTAAGNRLNESYGGTSNAYRNLFLSNVTDVRDVSTDFSKIGFDQLHGNIEVAVAMRSRIPSAILGTRDSLAGSSLNAGNFASARRLLTDGFISPHVWSLCEAMTPLAPPTSSGAVLAPDMSNVLMLQEDQLDQARIVQLQMSTIASGVTSGFNPEDVVEKVVAGDLTELEHTGLASVQLQPIGEPGSDLEYAPAGGHDDDGKPDAMDAPENDEQEIS